MHLDGKTTVGRLAVAEPRAIALFERWGVDYCCGGEETVESLCERVGVTLKEMEKSIELQNESPQQRSWANEPLIEVTEFIISRYHSYTREELALIEDLCKKVFDAHKQGHPSWPTCCSSPAGSPTI